jgi:cell division initiation protein
MFKFSAEDIANQTFQSRFRGYDTDQVHEFLETLAKQWRELQKSHRELEDELDQQTRELRDYRRREKSLVQALEMARQVAEEIRHQADRDAEMVLADTELKAERMLARAEQRVSELRGEMFELQQQRARFYNETRQMLQSYGSMFDQYEARSKAGDEQAHPLPPVPGADRAKNTAGADDDERPNTQEICDEDVVSGATA